MHTQSNPKEDYPPEIVPPIQPKAPWRITEVKALPGFRLWVKFVDGKSGFVSMADLVHSQNAGVFAALRDETVFSQAHLDFGAVTWPGELDLAPDAMHSHIVESGEWVLS